MTTPHERPGDDDEILVAADDEALDEILPRRDPARDAPCASPRGAPTLVWLGTERLLMAGVARGADGPVFLATRLLPEEWQRVVRSAMTLEAAYLAGLERGELWLVRRTDCAPLRGRRLSDIPSGWLPPAFTLEDLGLRVASVDGLERLLATRR